MLHRQLFITILSLLMAAMSLCAQSSKNVRKQQQRNRQEIEQAEKKKRANAATVEKSLKQLNLLDGQIGDLNRDVYRLNRRVDSLTAIITPLRDSVNTLDRHLDEMCARYATALRRSQANRKSMNDIAFVFSSSSFTQAWERYRSLRQFSRWRAGKAAEIVAARTELNGRREQLDSLVNRNHKVLQRIDQQRLEVEKKKTQTDQLVKSLKSQSRQLDQIIKRRQAEAVELDRKLERALAEEMRQREEQERREREKRQREEQKKQQADGQQGKPQKQQPAEPVELPVSPLTGSFESNRGRLPYPVRGQYTVVKKFGRQQHPRLPKVEINSTGIDIEATTGATVQSVFSGEVSQIFKLAGYNNVVVVRHGDFVTVYANLASLSVKKGDNVTGGQALGKLYVDRADSDRSILHFEVRREKDKLDPEAWLKR